VTPPVMVYVRDVLASLEFYEAVLPVERRHFDDDGSYGEIESGDARFAFVAEWHAAAHLQAPFRRNEARDDPAGFQLYASVGDVDAVYAHALEAGGVPVEPPAEKPWGRRAIVRDPDGILFEIGTDTASTA
jgi:lactoylglutathione lyase